ncbi:MAG: PEP-utilizing enzyme [Candidatus Micrarchaeota archaeon]
MKWNRSASREGVDLTTLSGVAIVFGDYISQYAKTHDELYFAQLKNKSITHYMAVDQQEVGRMIYKEYFNTPEQIEQYYREGLVFLKEVQSTCKKWSEKLKTQNDLATLANAYEDFRTQFMKVTYIYSISSFIAIEAWQTDCEKAITALIKKNNMKEADHVISSIYEPWKKTAILEIQDKIASGKTPAELAREYQFLRSWVAVWYRPIDETWIANLKPYKESQKPLSQKEIIELLSPNEKELYFIKMAPYIIFFKDWRDDVRRRIAYEWSFLFDAIARKFQVAHADVGYLSLDEIAELMKTGKIDVEKITRRKTNPCVVIVKGKELKIVIVEGKDFEKYQAIMDSLEKNEMPVEIKGLVAQGGKVTGRVRLIRSFHDVKKVEEGDVLVANTTHPNYLPAMQKACAFVTNEGGVVSHAAIVSREMKKPCIVGTKVATKMLRDGDLVEVDGDKGTVKKI